MACLADIFPVTAFVAREILFIFSRFAPRMSSDSQVLHYVKNPYPLGFEGWPNKYLADDELYSSVSLPHNQIQPDKGGNLCTRTAVVFRHRPGQWSVSAHARFARLSNRQPRPLFHC